MLCWFYGFMAMAGSTSTGRRLTLDHHRELPQTTLPLTFAPSLSVLATSEASVEHQNTILCQFSPPGNTEILKGSKLFLPFSYFLRTKDNRKQSELHACSIVGMWLV
jgi:hypothetical protein